MKRLLLFGLVVFIASGISAGEKADNFSKKENRILIVAHRGASKFAPENTVAAFLKAHEMGADMCEMDVRQTKDGHFVIMHDRSVRRTTNGKGLVKEMTLAEIKSLDAGSYFGKEFAGEKVPTLREVLQAIKGKILPDLDLKDGNIEELVKLLDEEGYLADSNVTFHGSWNNANKIKALTDKVLVRPGSKSGEAGLDKLLQEVNPPIVNINWGGFTEYYVSAIQKNGKKAFVNTLRKADKQRNMIRAIEAGADYIQSDNLDILVPLVNAHNIKLNPDSNKK